MARKPAESTDLTLSESARLPDAYEQSFMGDEGAVLYRSRHRAPWRIHVIFALLAGFVAGSAIATGQQLGLMIGLPAVALVWLLFSVLRVTVSTRHVNVQYGLFGRKIPVGSIDSSEVVTYDWLRGWSVHRSPGRTDKWIPKVWPGHGNEAVRIAWRDRKRGRSVILVGSRRADVLAAQIDRARRALPGDTPRALGPTTPESGEAAPERGRRLPDASTGAPTRRSP